MNRREMREHCFKMLFCAEFHPAEEIALQIEQYFQAPEEEVLTPEGVDELLHRVSLAPEDEAFLQERVEGMLAKIPALDEKLDTISEGWKTKRMSKVDLIILRQAIFEMLYDENVREKVAINEAVGLEKKFGGTDSSAFSNGILAKLATVE